MIKNIINKIKDCLEYRRNKRSAKHEVYKMGAAALPVIGKFVHKRADTIEFIQKLVESSKNIDGERLIEMVLDEAADKLLADRTRLVEILRYIVTLNTEDIRKIISHAATETISEN